MIEKVSNILLIQSLGELDQPSGFMRTCSLEPLALEYLESAIEEIGFSPHLYFGNIDTKKIIADINTLKPLAICFSVYTYQYEQTLKIIAEIKQKIRYRPYIILGGYHSTAMPFSVIENKNIDFVVIGEGEKTIQELLIALKNNNDISSIKGIAYKKNNKPVFTKARERIKNIDSIPLPKRHLDILANTGQYQITYPSPSKQQNVAQVSYSRGCPYSCEFCASENTWGRSVYWRDPKKVLDEIEMLHEKYGTNLIYFPDLTFNVNRQKVFDICNEFIKRDLPIHWWGLFRLDKLDREMIYALKEAKCVKLSIGIETSDNKVAQSVKGEYFLNLDKDRKMLSLANELGLILKAFLIIGFLTDTKERILNTLDYLFEIPIDEIRVTFITPFPGTAIWTDYCKKNVLKDNLSWNDFTTEHPIIKHSILSDTDLIKLRLNLVSNFYLDPRYLNRIADKINNHPHLKDSYFEYFKFLQVKEIFKNSSFDYELLKSKIHSTNGIVI